MKTPIATVCLALALALALTAAGYAAEDPKPSTSPHDAFPKKLDASGVDNLYQLGEGLYSGSKPRGEEGFRFLGQLGVKTILSVDGPAQDVALAEKHGMRYVHVPLGYDGITGPQALQIVQAAREQPGPLFVHCHYGKNRGPSAAAIVCMAQDGWSPERAVAWMKTAGTSPQSAGLFRDVRNFQVPSRMAAAMLPFDAWSGYFVSNQFEPDAPQSFLVITDQQRFAKVFGVATVMGDPSRRLPKDAFQASMVLSAIKRGKAYWEYKVENVTAAGGVVALRYTVTPQQSDTATFACPLIVSVPKGKYTAVQFVENGRPVKKVELAAGPQRQELRRCEVYYSGKVQGVGFRLTTWTLAKGFAVAGFVKNLPDGRVQLVVEGQPKEIASFLAAIRKEMGENISKTEETTGSAAGGFQGFEVRY